MTQQPTKIIGVKIEKVELHQTENAWRPGKFNDTTNGEAGQVGEVLIAMVQFGFLSMLQNSYGENCSTGGSFSVE